MYIDETTFKYISIYVPGKYLPGIYILLMFYYTISNVGQLFIEESAGGLFAFP